MRHADRPRSYSLPGVELKPYHIPVGAGFARIMAILGTQKLTMRHLPGTQTLGATTATFLWMLLLGLTLLAIGNVIQKRNWQETRLGLAAIWVSSIAFALWTYKFV